MRRVVFVVSCLLLASPWAFPFPGRFGLAPDNNRDLLLSVISSARDTLLVNIYEFENHAIADALVERVREGVTLKILVEGEPVGRVSPEGRRILIRLRDEMARSGNPAHRLYVMTDGKQDGSADPAPLRRRFVYNHAKYLLVDSRIAWVGTENFSVSGHALAGQLGNRGWVTAVEDRELASRLAELFREDTRTSFGDVVLIGPKDPIPGPEGPRGPRPQAWVVSSPWAFPGGTPGEQDQTRPRPVHSIPEGRGDVSRATLVTSPDALEELTRLIRSADHRLDLEHMSLPSTWRENPTAEPKTSSLVAELLTAARRGVAVRVLLNNEHVFGGNPNRPRPNDITARLLQNEARCRHLPISAKIVDVDRAGITYIHNKGLIVDDELALVSSINGTRNSVFNNREVAVALWSRDAARYYRSAFDFDWESSPELSEDRRNPCVNDPLIRLEEGPIFSFAHRLSGGLVE